MNFKQIMMDKLKANVANRVANDTTLIREVASAILEDIDYTDIASDLNISSADIACEIDHGDVLSEITGHLDMDDLKQLVAEKYDMNVIAGKVVSMLPSEIIDELAEQATDEIIKEMALGCSI